MDPALLVCKSVYRDAFQKEDYTGEDDIFALVESGSFVFDSGNGVQTVGPLEGVNFRRGIRYHRRITSPARMYLFRYRSREDILGSEKVVFQDQNRIQSTLQLLQLSDNLVQQDDFVCKQTLFADLMNQYRLENIAQLTQASHADQIVSDAIHYINRNLHQKINLSELAAQYYLSYIQFSRRFKKATGATPQEYVAGLRLKKAKFLLEESTLSIKQIAQDCGFSSEYYFSNFFRSRCSLSPTNYRTMIKTTDPDE